MSKWRMLFAICSFAALYQLFWTIRHKKRKLPPGPSNLMSLYYIAKMFLIKRTFDPEYVVSELMRHYGEHGIIFHSVVIANLVQLTTSEMAKKVLNHKHALYRPVFGKHKNTSLHIDIESTADGTKPFANINGPPWEKRRKLAQSIMFRMCTQSKFLNKILYETMNNIVFPELDELCNSNNTKLWYPKETMQYCAYNTVYYSNNGQHTDPNDKLYKLSIEVITETFALFKSGIVYAILPKYLMILVRLNPYSDYHKIVNVMDKRAKLSIEYEKRREEEEQKQQQQPIAIQQNGIEEKKEAIYYRDYIQTELTESEASADLGALIAAGTDTTSSGLTWAITLCAKYENIQTLIRNELIECFMANKDKNKDMKGDKKYFHLNWINQLVYFRAFIYEVLRVSSVVKFGLPHYAAGDIFIDVNNKNVCIPKGTIIGYGIEFIHKYTDRENWVNSNNEICLENWINSKTKKFELNESFLTFGSGRRDCVGRNLAIKELYIIMAYLLLNYKFSFRNKEDVDKPIKASYNGINVIDPPIGVVVEYL
eukprot:205060_1